MRFAHIALIVADLNRSAVFYEQVLGLTRIERPAALAFDGLWYGLNHEQHIHLMLLDNPYAGSEKPVHGGRDNHVAFYVDDYDAIQQRLDAARISYTTSKSGRSALFFRDPDGNTFELIKT